MTKLLSLKGWMCQSMRPAQLPDIGSRELDVLEALWRNDRLTAQAALDQIQSAGISLSTMQSTLERLNRKQLVSRKKIGRAYVYQAAISKEAIISRLIHEIADSLAGGETALMVSGFMDYLGKESQEGSEALQALWRIKHKKKR